MPQRDYGLIEMAFSFGTILAIAVWQLISLERAKKMTSKRLARDSAKAEAERDAS